MQGLFLISASQAASRRCFFLRERASIDFARSGLFFLQRDIHAETFSRFRLIHPRIYSFLFTSVPLELLRMVLAVERTHLGLFDIRYP